MLASMSAAAPVSGRLDALSLGAILVTLVFWASAFTGIRVGLEHFTPGPLALYRFLVASVTLLIYMSVTRLPVPERRDLWHIGVLSVAGISLYHVLLNSGQQSVPAGTASLIIAAGPVITALLASRFSGEKLNALGWLGTAVSLGGVALIVLGRGQSVDFTRGALLVLAAAFFTSVYFVFQKGVLARVGSLRFTVWSLILGTVPMLVFLPALATELRAAPPSAHLALLYLGVFPSALAYMTWTFAIARVGASVTSSFLYVSPVLAILMAWALLGEVPGAVTLLGGAVALAGVLLVNTRGRPQ
ncbi:DMT family transporter [Deinococcus wulumuqiensis R12]|uniref:Membrane protein n=2 Tax=Deinococcus wulumuqiensis TaxID=980427 RepID=A0AAV4K7S8_9DEIO|nr:DMT family transporter [Deinococcus wulumuqiensis R12]GGI91081.1 membrane protein [Deinococcus wulumuqiensis]GGP30925.1 membrane protein [Deinococcus wulumuqiensis]